VGGGAEQACKPPLRANSPCDAAQNRTLGSAAGGGSARPTAPAQRGRGTDRRAQRRAVGGGGKPRARRPGSRPPPGFLRRGPALPAACPHPHVLFAAPGGRSPSPVSTAELGSQKAREPEVVAAEIRTFPTSVRGGNLTLADRQLLLLRNAAPSRRAALRCRERGEYLLLWCQRNLSTSTSALVPQKLLDVLLVWSERCVGCQ
jgi:hypothetical protein